MTPGTSLQPLDLDVDLTDLERAVRPTMLERLIWRYQYTRLWIREHAVDLVVLTVLIALALIVHMRGMYDTPARFDDEGTYTAYAWAVEYEHRLSHYTYWYAHPPLGWIQMAFWNWISDGFNRAPYAIASVRQFMVVCKVVSVVLMYVLALRLRMTRVAAAGAVLMFALSPLAVYFTRTALLDNVVTPWLLAAFLFAASRRRGLGSAAAAAACFAVAVLSKETVLLFLPALALLFWQCSDRRNRKFTVTIFGATLVLLLMLYPTYALIKNEFFEGKGHVSLLWAIQWQLFDRQGSGSIFNAQSTAHAVASSWMIQDPWLTKLSLLLIVPGLIARRTRAVALAFGIQVFELLRSGYLPYPFVVAMIPFAALTVAGVLDVIWQRARTPLPARLASSRLATWLTADRPAARGALTAPERSRLGRFRRHLAMRVRARQFVRVRRHRKLGIATKVTIRAALVSGIVALLVVMQSGWTARIHDLWYDDHDRGAAEALTWVRSNVATSQWVVVDDAFWVDLVRDGFQEKRTIWFTKLDVDPAVKLPTKPAWKGIDYVVLTYQDEMSLHLTLDDKPTSATAGQFPTIYGALSHSQIVGRFGPGTDRVVIWRVSPTAAANASNGSSP
jgi:4-amino-4-deoxy-L-arabinose transferase-like glycosyltransferase